MRPGHGKSKDAASPPLRARLTGGCRALLCVTICGPVACTMGCSQATATDSASAGARASQQQAAPLPVTLALGDVDLRQTRPLENSTLYVRFQAHAVAAAEGGARLQKLLARRQHQAREQVLIAVRSAETWEFDEPDLSRLRRRIQLRLNRWLDAPLVEDVVLTEFRFRVDH